MQHRYTVLQMAQRWVLRVGAFSVALSEPGVQVATCASFALWGAQWFKQRREAPQPDGERPGLWRSPAFLIVLGLAGWLAAGLIGGALNGFPPRPSRLDKVFLAMAMLVGGWALPRLERSEIKRLVVFLGAGAAIALLAGALQMSVGSFPGESWLYGPGRGYMGQLYIPGTLERAATGTLLNRLKTAEALLFCCAVFTSVALSATSDRVRKLSFAALLLVVFGVLGTFTKSSLPSFAVAALCLGLLRRYAFCRRYFATVVAAGMAALLVAVVVAGTTMPSQPTVPRDSTLQQRRWIWQRGLHIADAYPVFGAGAAAYEKAAPQFVTSGPNAFYAGAHCQHLTQLAEAGMVGFGFWIITWIGILLALHRAWTRSSSVGMGRDFSTLYLVTLIPMMFFHDLLFHPGTAALFWLAIGGLCAGPKRILSPVTRP